MMSCVLLSLIDYNLVQLPCKRATSRNRPNSSCTPSSSTSATSPRGSTTKKCTTLLIQSQIQIQEHHRIVRRLLRSTNSLHLLPAACMHYHRTHHPQGHTLGGGGLPHRHPRQEVPGLQRSYQPEYVDVQQGSHHCLLPRSSHGQILQSPLSHPRRHLLLTCQGQVAETRQK